MRGQPISMLRSYIHCRGGGDSNMQRARELTTTYTMSTIPLPEEGCYDKRNLLDTVTPYIGNQTPVVLRGAASHSSAIQKWKTWEYFENVVDSNTVCHVEVGGNYASANSARCDIRFTDYLVYLHAFEARHGKFGKDSPPTEELVYLAQNDLFDELYQDIVIPDFCTDTAVGEGKLYNTMIWIGPYGCVSPLHFDPMENALIQLVGTKKVMMYPPEVHVYAGVDGHQSNTSPLNPEHPIDLSRYPLAADLPPCMETTISPGDVLFIPKKWWHYIRTIETSVSVNSWWR